MQPTSVCEERQPREFIPQRWGMDWPLVSPGTPRKPSTLIGAGNPFSLISGICEPASAGMVISWVYD